MLPFDPFGAERDIIRLRQHSGMGLRFHPSGSWVQLPPSGQAKVFVTAVLMTPLQQKVGALVRVSYNISFLVGYG